MKPTILLVDDNKEILEVLEGELSESYSIIKALNGRQAVELLPNKSIDLIVSDVMMPGMDGFELCKIVKSDFDSSHIPVILLTAKNTLDSKITGLELGADAYLEKPFDVDHLLAQISSLITNRNKLKDYFARLPMVQLNSVTHSLQDKAFLDQLSKTIEGNFEDQDLEVEKLASKMNMSRTSLFRKIKSITNLTPNELINITRLKRAAELLANADYKIYEVANMVGYNSQTNFGRNFYKQFGMTPTEFQKNKLLK